MLRQLALFGLLSDRGKERHLFYNAEAMQLSRALNSSDRTYNKLDRNINNDTIKLQLRLLDHLYQMSCHHNLLRSPILSISEGARMWTIPKAIDRWRAWNNLLDYPVYLPPFRDSETCISREQANANYKYFENEKSSRVELLLNYLSDRSVNLGSKQDDFVKLDRWVYRYGGHLLPDGGDVIYALSDYEPTWQGEYHGLNIVNDIAILVGDYIVLNNSDTSWGLWYGDDDYQAEEMPGFYQPCIFGLKRYGYNKPLPILHTVYEYFEASRLRLKSVIVLPKSYDAVGNFTREIAAMATQNSY